MAIGFLDLSQTRRVPDKDYVRNIKPIYTLSSLGDGYESRISLGTNSVEETFSLNFNNRSIQEIEAISGFLEERGGFKTFIFTVPDEEELSGELDVVVYCLKYNRTYVNDVISSLSATFVRVFEEDSDTSQLTILDKNILIDEGSSKLVRVETNNRGPETLYWTIDGVLSPDNDFQDIEGNFTTSGTNSLSTGNFYIYTLADSLTEGVEEYTLNIRATSTVGPVLASTAIIVKDTSVGAEAFSLVNSLGNPVSSLNLASGSTVTVYVGVANFDPGNPLYISLDPSAQASLIVTPTFRVVDLVGTFAESEGVTTFNSILDVESPTVLSLNLRKNSITGEILDSLNLNVLPPSYIGGRIVDQNNNDAANVPLDINSPYTTTVRYAGKFYDIQQIYWTIEGATGGVDFSAISGSFIPTGNFELNTATFNITKLYSGDNNLWTIYLRTGSVSGTIIDSCVLLWLPLNSTFTEELEEFTTNKQLSFIDGVSRNEISRLYFKDAGTQNDAFTTNKIINWPNFSINSSEEVVRLSYPVFSKSDSFTTNKQLSFIEGVSINETSRLYFKDAGTQNEAFTTNKTINWSNFNNISIIRSV